MEYQLILSNHELATFCESASKAPALAVDTEFVRTRTLYPRLGLIQLYDGNDLVLVDPLAVTDMAPLQALMLNENVVKVLHSCSEDLETFWHSLNVIPTPIFDTQFAACLLGMGATLGYANLVHTCLGIELDKGESRTDWIARPLRNEQLQYAANDVLYLWQLYPELRENIEKLDRVSWIYSEMEQLAMKRKARLPAEIAYYGIKNNWQLHGRSLYLLKQLAAWRYELAVEKDMALNFVIREQTLVEVARRKPTHKGSLFKLDGITPQEARLHGAAILEMVEASKDVPPELYPPAVDRLIDYPGFKKTVASIRQACQELADRLSVPVEVVGSKKQIHQLLKWVWFEHDETKAMGLVPDLIAGWRKPLLLDTLEGILGKQLETQSL